MSKKRAKIIHFRENCIGCNSCTEHAPDNWEIDPTDGKARLKRSVEKDGIFIAEICDVEQAANKCAAHDCPVGIIRFLNEQGKDITKEL